VEELAQPLDLTPNAVRAHLATLERDGLVRQEGVRRGSGAGKPALVYELAPGAEPLFSRAYLPLLVKTVEALSDRLPAAELHTLMRDVGRRLARAYPPSSGTLPARAQAASLLLDELGGVTTIQEERGALTIKGLGCPLSALTSHRPEVCTAVEAMLAEAVGAPVTEHCDRTGRPRCEFRVPLPRGARR
jgi:predicted ArsR family transcriptional regulator